MENCVSSFSSLCAKNPFCEYKSTRFIRVRDQKLVCVYYSVIIGVILYILLFTVVKNRGYQTFGQVAGTTSLKVKGTGSVGNYSDWRKAIPYDSTDLIYPPAEQDALFVTTSQLITANQTLKICNGNKDVGKCTVDSNCTANVYTVDSYGITTGKCGSNGYCQVKGWCPVEDSSVPLSIINNVGNFTVFVKINVHFSAFGVSRSNLEDRNHNASPILGYNLFEVNDMLSRATDGTMNNVKLLAKKGAIIAVTSIWNCNLDKGAENCNPVFRFKRLDNSTNSVSLGYNFRTADYDPTGTARRLRKLIGVRFVFVVDGKAGKFSFAALSVTFGAGLAYIGIASFITDIVLERFLPESNKYAKAKNQNIYILPTAPSTKRIFRDDKASATNAEFLANEQHQELKETATSQTSGEIPNKNVELIHFLANGQRQELKDTAASQSLSQTTDENPTKV